MRKWIKTAAVVAAMGALSAVTDSGTDFTDLDSLARAAAIGAMSGLVLWMRSPQDDKPKEPTHGPVD